MLAAVKRERDGLIVANRVEIADTLRSRFLGLMWREQLPDGHGMLIRRCSSIHTAFMNFAIDVIYLNGKDEVVAIDSNIKPWRCGAIHFEAKHVLELPCSKAGELRVGDKLEIIEERA